MVTTVASPHRVLILADQPLVVDLISLTLNHGAFVTRDVSTLDEAREVVADWNPHVALIDMDLGGPASLRPLHPPADATRAVPIVALTRRGDLKRKLEAFDQGVDDVLTVPFSPEELLARSIVISRRTSATDLPLVPTIRLGEITLDIVDRQVRVGRSVVPLSAIEQSLLYLLASRGGRVVTREEILDATWGTDFVAGSNVVDRHIRSLRIKLHDDYRHPRFIATVPGQGYRFVPTFSNAGWAGDDVPS